MGQQDDRATVTGAVKRIDISENRLADNLQQRIKTVVYDRKGRVIERIYYDGEKSLWRETFSYSGNRLSRRNYFDETGSLNTRVRYFYTRDGRRAKVESRDARNMLLETEQVELDTNARRLRSEVLLEDGSMVVSQIIQRDSAGRVVSEINFSPPAPAHGDYKRFYKYDFAGNLIELFFHAGADGSPTTRVSFRYDDRGFRKEEVKTALYNGASSRTVFSEYIVDSFGNWIGRTETATDTREGDPRSVITTRRLVYWDRP